MQLTLKVSVFTYRAVIHTVSRLGISTIGISRGPCLPNFPIGVMVFITVRYFELDSSC
jgi:hypothetical protein